jgi:Rab GDP dissociation inhibitor
MWKKFRWTDEQRRLGAEKAKAEEDGKPIPSGPAGPEPPAAFGKKASEWNQWHISLVPKFLMADGELTNILRKTRVTNYIELLQVGGSYVVKDGRPYKVPSTRMEAMASSLVPHMQKFYMQKFLQFIADYKEDVPSTHKKGIAPFLL